MSYIQTDFHMQIKKYVFGKSQGYDTVIPRQEKCQQAVA